MRVELWSKISNRQSNRCLRLSQWGSGQAPSGEAGSIKLCPLPQEQQLGFQLRLDCKHTELEMDLLFRVRVFLTPEAPGTVQLIDIGKIITDTSTNPDSGGPSSQVHRRKGHLAHLQMWAGTQHRAKVRVAWPPDEGCLQALRSGRVRVWAQGAGGRRDWNRHRPLLEDLPEHAHHVPVLGHGQVLLPRHIDDHPASHRDAGLPCDALGKRQQGTRSARELMFDAPWHSCE